MVMILLISKIAAEEEEDCKGNGEQLAIECQNYIQKPGPVMDPSKECCVQFQNTDITCMCHQFTKHKDIEKIVSMEKVVYVAKYCQCPLKSGSKCGSKLAVINFQFSFFSPSLDTRLKFLIM